MAQLLHNIAESSWFKNFITATILFAGVLVGLETYPAILAEHGDTLHMLDLVVLTIFIVEIVVKMGAEGKKPWRYFRDPWNCFDFFIVAACLVPGAGQYAMVLRLLRLLRILKLVRALPKLQILVTALLRSIPSMFYVTVLLMMLFYIYAVAGVFIFGVNDPVHFETLDISMLSLFRIVTLEDWTDIMYINMYGCDRYGYDADSTSLCVDPQAFPTLSPFFFVSFVLFGTMIVLNLFIGVIMNGMDDARSEAYETNASTARAMMGIDAEPTVADDLQELHKELADLQLKLGAIQRKLERDA